MDEEGQALVSRERKQSSGDLHSRLKTRKLLGVGETDDGDVHRSKLSQILGHSDRLYAKLPSGVKEWQLATAVAFGCFGLTSVCRPDLLFKTGSGECSTSQQPAARLYGACLLTISLGLWAAWKSLDREIARLSLLGIALHSAIQLIVAFVDALLGTGSWLASFTWLALPWTLTQLAALLSGAYLLVATLSHRRGGKWTATANQSHAEDAARNFAGQKQSSEEVD